ncbi:MAG: hypothetical protein UY90_C0065G0003 [Candidatus Peregrinibacteria bacterium GW2011_GWA2_54_9]|nr:MAG: hypothetical protein UY90_C0065G0003 [Candidatus Peregrinibacteria bacterium GW2011_GWA2_54_9]
MGQKIFCFVIGLSIGGLLLALAERIKPERGAVYEIPIIKDEKGLKIPRGVYRVTTYNGRAYLMIELPKGLRE